MKPGLSFHPSPFRGRERGRRREALLLENNLTPRETDVVLDHFQKPTNQEKKNKTNTSGHFTSVMGRIDGS